MRWGTPHHLRITRAVCACAHPHASPPRGCVTRVCVDAARVAKQGVSYLRDSLTIVSTPPPAPVPPEGDRDDSTRHWKVIVLGIVAAIVLIFWLGVGFGQRWGAQQWGPFADWLVGALTLGAVVVALRESLRGQHARAVDHEVARRRECLKAVGDVWTGLAQMVFPFLSFTDYLENLPVRFDGNLPRQDNVPPDHPGEAIAYDIGERAMSFFTKWGELVEPPLFVALALVKNTPMDEPMKEINAGIRDLMENELKKVMNVEMMGRRPDVSTFSAKWNAILRNREEHLNLARKHFAVDLKTVEAEMGNR